MAYLGRNTVTNHLEFSDAADLLVGQYAASANWIGETAHITSASPTNPNSIWICVLNASGVHEWLQIATASAVLLPDQRFTVGRSAYNLLDPGVATFLTVASGIAGALAGTGLNPPSVASSAFQRLVEIEPDTYAEDIALQPYVHLRGMGTGPDATRITGGVSGQVTYNGGAAYITVKDMEFDNLDFLLTPTGALSIRFENCNFINGCTWTLNTLGNGVVHSVDFVNCLADWSSFQNSVGALDNLIMRVIGGQNLGEAVGPGIQFICSASVPTFSGVNSSSATLYIADGVIFGSTVGEAAAFNGLGSANLETGNCTVGTGGTAFSLFAVSALQLLWSCHAGTRTGTTPRSYFNVQPGSLAAFTGGELEITQATAVAGSAPLDPVSGGTVLGSPVPSNRQRAPQRFQFVVPASQSGGGGPYASGPAAVAAMTVNAITPDNAYVDETRVQCIYPSVTTDPIQPDTSLFATTFRYASYQLTDPLFLENGRERVFKNVGDPSDAIQGPVVLVLPPGSLSRIDYLDSRPYDGGGVPVNPVYTSAQYVILAPGSSVRLSVDRDTATPRYLVTT